MPSSVDPHPVACTFCVSDVADERVRAAIATPLLAYNESQFGPAGHRPLVVAMRDSQNRVVGGLWGATSY
ncbi:MAG: hypothetical protein WCH44_11225 [Betaproteobacteria bacterium]